MDFAGITKSVFLILLQAVSFLTDTSLLYPVDCLHCNPLLSSLSVLFLVYLAAIFAAVPHPPDCIHHLHCHRQKWFRIRFVYDFLLHNEWHFHFVKSKGNHLLQHIHYHIHIQRTLYQALSVFKESQSKNAYSPMFWQLFGMTIFEIDRHPLNALSSMMLRFSGKFSPFKFGQS